MKDSLKITSWNVEWLDKIWGEQIDYKKEKRLQAIKQEILELDSDILCMLESVKGEEKIKSFCSDFLEGKYQPVLAKLNDYKLKGRQWIWFIVKPELIDVVELLPTNIYDEFAGTTWNVNYWGDFESTKHKHYRHPQVLILNWQNTRIELMGLHTKSKFVRGGKSAWNSGGTKRNKFIEDAIKARIKMTTEITNVRNYIDKKFKQVSNPAIMVMGDLNDGPGKEYFEKQYIFFDLLSNLQGDVFSAKKFLNHALFDFPENLRWSVYFKDFIDPNRNPNILLDHILFTQSFVNNTLPIKINKKAGFVEHEVHDLINANNPKYANTSDHKPISIIIDKNTSA